MLLIEFSASGPSVFMKRADGSPGYELSRRAGVLGTPERPLSDLGLRSYVTFWISVLVRFFRSVQPLSSGATVSQNVRRILTVAIPEIARISGPSVDGMIIEDVDGTRRWMRSKGLDSEMSDLVAQTPLHSAEGACATLPPTQRRRRLNSVWYARQCPSLRISGGPTRWSTRTAAPRRTLSSPARWRTFRMRQPCAHRTLRSR